MGLCSLKLCDVQNVVQNCGPISPLKNVWRSLSSGEITGVRLIDIILGAFVHLFCKICNFFRMAMVWIFTLTGIMNLTKLLNTCTGAFDLLPVTPIMAKLKDLSKESGETKTQLNSLVGSLLNPDQDKEDPSHPSAPNSLLTKTSTVSSAVKESLLEALPKREPLTKTIPSITARRRVI